MSGCPETEAVQAYVDGLATVGERAAIEQHVRSCAPCRDVLMVAGTWQGEPEGPAAVLGCGARIDRFVVDRVLGAGGMGVVYAARDPELGRRVALKLLREESRDRRERLAREARALARVVHPNVCAVYDIGTHDGRLFIAMELVDGETLGRWSQAQRRPWRDVVAVFTAAARGLAAAHSAGVIHRDFKPDNVLVGTDGRVRVTDFGMAAWSPEISRRSWPSGSVDLTQTGAVLGTPRYMAPEQHAGELADEKSDQWSFAAALHEALHGQLPFCGSTVAELGESKAVGRIEPIPSSRVPRWLERLVRRGLAVRRSDRWPSMAAIVDALERKRARRGLAWAAALLGVAAVAAAIALVVRSSDPSDHGADAARLAALAEAMEAGLRIEHLAPPHDLRPARQKIRAQVEWLRPKAADGDGPANFALGKGLELLGDDAGAREAYQRAWTAGFQLPRVADGLGTVLSNLYRREYSEARGLLAGAALEDRVAALHRDLAAPATQYLAAGGGEPWRIAMHRAAIALLARDFPAARAAADEALAADPSRYEALALQAEAWRSEALFLHTNRHDRTAPLTHALEAAEGAARYGRSDQELALLCIDIRRMLLLTRTLRGETTAAAVASLMSAVDEAETLDPDAPRLLVARSLVLKLQIRNAEYQSVGSAHSLLERAITTMRRAAELDGGEVNTLEELAQLLAIRASAATGRGAPDEALPFLDEGLRAIDRAIAREPKSGKAYARAQQLHKDKAVALKLQRHWAEYFEELRRAVTVGDEAIRLAFEDAPMVHIMKGAALVDLAEEAWQNGRDPRPEARAGVKLVEDGMRRSADDLWATQELIVSRGKLAEYVLRIGDDPTSLLDSAREVVDQALERRPDVVWLVQYKGWLALLNAQGRLAAGKDASAALAEAERLLASSVPQADEDLGRRYLVQLTIAQARWQAARGEDPTAALRKARADIDEQAHRQPRWGEDLVAECALEAARWARRSGRDTVADARRGLTAVAAVLSDGPRDVPVWVQKAALEALAGDRLQARSTLAHAAALNELVRGSRAFQDAQALAGM